MSDIVERLREGARVAMPNDEFHNRLALRQQEAAAEIERLRAIVEEKQASLGFVTREYDKLVAWQDNVKRGELHAEIERLNAIVVRLFKERDEACELARKYQAEAEAARGPNEREDDDGYPD